MKRITVKIPERESRAFSKLPMRSKLIITSKLRDLETFIKQPLSKRFNSFTIASLKTVL